MNTLLLFLLAYVLGSIPTGYWVVKALKGIDLRTVGSGSTGTTNVLRTAGKKAAAFVFLADIAKGYIPVWLTIYAIDHNLLPELSWMHALDIPATSISPAQPGITWVVFFLAMACLIGHARSMFLGFKGGKSAATAFGTTLAMNPIASLLCFSLFIALIYFFRYVSLASIIGVQSSFIPMWYYTHTLSYSAFCFLGGLYVMAKHKDNIKRLMAGTEPKIGQKAKLPDAGTVSSSDSDAPSTSSIGGARGLSSDGDGRGLSSDGDGRGLSSDGDGRGLSSDGDGRGLSSDGDGRGTSSDSDGAGTASAPEHQKWQALPNANEE